MQELSTKQEKNAPPTPQTGKADINAVREGLAMVMDGLRVMEQAGARVSKAMPLSDGKTLLLPVIQIHDHVLGYTVMDDKKVFTVDGISVMEVVTLESETE